jgi:hypothetical protein
MKTFGDMKIAWPSSIDGKLHVIVAVRHGGWREFCRARPNSYETVELVSQPTDDPVVWLHDRAEITCPNCIAMLDGAKLEFVKVDL